MVMGRLVLRCVSCFAVAASALQHLHNICLYVSISRSLSVVPLGLGSPDSDIEGRADVSNDPVRGHDEGGEDWNRRRRRCGKLPPQPDSQTASRLGCRVFVFGFDRLLRLVLTFDRLAGSWEGWCHAAFSFF